MFVVYFVVYGLGRSALGTDLNALPVCTSWLVDLFFCICDFTLITDVRGEKFPGNKNTSALDRELRALPVCALYWLIFLWYICGKQMCHKYIHSLGGGGGKKPRL